MSCTKHFLGFHWDHHTWIRQVTHTESRTIHETDQWGCSNEEAAAFCHVRYVCKECGAVREGEECRCEQERAEQCACRLNAIDAANERPELRA